MIRYNVWIPEQHRTRVRLLLEAMNTHGYALRLPVEPWPTSLDWDGSGPTMSWASEPSAPSRIGHSTGYDVFARPGWTAERFADFVISRDHLHVVVTSGPSPTLAALAGYLQAPIFVEVILPGGREVAFITAGGNVAISSHDDGQQDLTDLREIFFAEGLEAVLAVPGWSVHKSGPPAPYGIHDAALQRRVDLIDWKAGYEDGKVTVPAGAELIPLNMVIPAHEDVWGPRPVIGHVRSSRHLYEVIVAPLNELGPLEVMCAVDGELQHFIDPVTGGDKGLGAHAADWANWILRHSVPGGPGGNGPSSDTQPWEGDGLDARMYRLAHNIVNYEDHDADTTYFSTALEVETWVRRSLGNHGAPIAVGLLDDVSFTLAADSPALIQKHLFERAGGLQAGYQPNAFRPWAGTQNWWHPERRAYTRTPSIQTVMDGEKLEAYTAANCLDYADVEPYMLPAGARANENSWFIVRLGNTPTCIAFPAQRTILTVRTDNDGATAEFAAHQYFVWIGQQDRRNKFGKQWAHWLDENHQLTAEEIQDGLKALVQIIERSDDEPDDE